MNKIFPIISTLTAMVFIAGCSIGQSTLEQAEQAKLKTDDSFRNPKEITKLSDGRLVFLSTHYQPGQEPRDVYFVGTTVTTTQVIPGIAGTSIGETQEAVVSIASLGELTTDQKVRKAAMLSGEASRLVKEAQQQDIKNRSIAPNNIGKSPGTDK